MQMPSRRLGNDHARLMGDDYYLTIDELIIRRCIIIIIICDIIFLLLMVILEMQRGRAGWIYVKPFARIRTNRKFLKKKQPSSSAEIQYSNNAYKES